MSGYTKGPWVAIGTDPAEGVDCFWINAQPNAAMRGFTKNIGAVNGSQASAEQAANAALIAAAPELLEALKKCAGVCAGEIFGKNALIGALEAARAAIAKAEGAAS